MKEELTKKLEESFPDLFPGSTFVACGDGWFGLVFMLCSVLERIKKSNIKILQIKEKWGGLRFYVVCANEEQLDYIDMAEEFSFFVCENCGRIDKGVTTEGKGWIRTLCNDCRSNYERENKGKSI